MQKDLEILCSLQKLDNKIFQIDKKAKRLPKQLKELEEKNESDNKAIIEINQNLEDNLQKQMNHELDISANLKEINNYESQLLSVKTNKEYKALNSEIAFKKEKNASIEEKLIELLEEESILKNEKKSIEIVFTSDKKKLEEERVKIDAEIHEYETQINVWEQKKKDLGKKIPEILFRRYNRLISHKNGKAIAEITKEGVCSGCHFKIRPQIVVEVIKGNSIITCENCSRIFIPIDVSSKEN
ncbi:MAG: C4-type zinc ribbon domain-containing protein [Candidatus Cloacimonadota bacterium]|nr:C4-type zinc ribbon domain-containing protein [Candidatus Cloacimonadota bacterium]